MSITQKELKRCLFYDKVTGYFTSRVRLSNVLAGCELGSKTTSAKCIRLHGIKYEAAKLAFLYVSGIMPDRVSYTDGNRHNTAFHNLTLALSKQDEQHKIYISRAEAALPGWDFARVTSGTKRKEWKVVCPEGHLSIRDRDNIFVGTGCAACTGKVRTLTQKIADARKVHGNLYDYNRVTSTAVVTVENIKCHAHGYFNQRWVDHVHNGAGCPKCGVIVVQQHKREHYRNNPDAALSTYKSKPYKWGRETLNLHGYEPQALNHLRQLGYRRRDVAVLVREGKPTVQYCHDDTGQRTYIPDFYLPNEDMVIEVKSDYTWSSDYGHNRKRNIAKLDATRELHNVWLLIMNKDGTVAKSIKRNRLNS